MSVKLPKDKVDKLRATTGHIKWTLQNLAEEMKNNGSYASYYVLRDLKIQVDKIDCIIEGID